MVGIVAGFPDRLLRTFRSFRKRASLSYRDGWDIQPLPSNSKFFDINVKELIGLLESNKANPPHVFSFRPSDKKQQFWIQENIVPYFRFRWLPNTLIQGDVDWANYLKEMDAILEEEESWDQKIKPQDVTSPLLLPEDYFKAKSQVRDLWMDATKSGTQRINDTERKMHRFSEFHEKRNDRSKKIWFDQSSNEYCWQGERHGVASFPNCIKYSFAIPEGFHFDVSSSNGGTVTLGSKTNKYLNVDPHGKIRG